MSDITYHWTILRLRTELGRIVRDVTFRRSATHGHDSVHVEGTITLPPPEAGRLVAYADLTEA